MPNSAIRFINYGHLLRQDYIKMNVDLFIAIVYGVQGCLF